MKQEHTSIQRKLMQVILMICSSVLLLTCIAFFIYELITYRKIIKNELATIGQIIAANSTASLAFDDKEDANEILSALKVQKHVVAACLYDKNGNVFAVYPVNLEAQSFPSIVKAEGFSYSGNHMEGFLPVKQSDRYLGTLYLKYNLKGVYQRFLLYGILAVIIFMISSFLAYLLSKKLQQSISTPILELAQTARKISEKKDYSVRAVKRSNDEIGTLTGAFNQMLTQIETQNAEIKLLNEGLEEKVIVRTNELQASNNMLRQQNEFIETIIDSSVDLIAVFNRDLQYVILNMQADHIYSRKREEMIGRNILEVFPTLEGTSMIMNLKKAFEGEFIHDDVYKSLLSDRFFENFFVPLRDKDGDVDRVLVIGHDLTNIMVANEKLKVLNAELEKSNKDLEQFAYVASHDLQEPLRKIQTFSDLCERNINNHELSKKYMQKINASANRMSELIRAILNYSKLSKIENELIPVDLNILVQEIKTDLELLIEEKKAVIETNELPVIHCIPLQISQLFLNLISNSLKFSNATPHIRIRASFVLKPDQIRITPLNSEDRYVELSFSDNGIGFNQQYADRAFAIFQRLHPGDQFSGTGIGLALCKKIVENHKGMITVESEPGKGTTFYIYLPLKRGTPDQQKDGMSIAIEDIK